MSPVMQDTLSSAAENPSSPQPIVIKTGKTWGALDIWFMEKLAPQGRDNPVKTLTSILRRAT